MREPPAVSIIIPSRNCLSWLPRAVGSIGAVEDAEIIVVDDGSTDGTADWLMEASLRDPRLVVMNGPGTGPSAARNCAIGAARAPLLAFLDADDTWHLDKLAAQRALHRDWPEIAFSFTDYRHVTEDGEHRGSCFDYWPRFRARLPGRIAPFALGGDAVAQIYAENVVGTSTVIARTDLVRLEGGFSTELTSSEDWDLWLRLAQRSPVACIPRVLADYLMHRPGNVTGNMGARLAAVRVIGDRHEAAVRKFGFQPVNALAVRVLDAKAELAQCSGAPWRAAGLRLASALRAPSPRSAYALMGALRRVAVR